MKVYAAAFFLAFHAVFAARLDAQEFLHDCVCDRNVDPVFLKDAAEPVGTPVGSSAWKELFVPAATMGTDDRIRERDMAKRQGTTVASLRKNHPTRNFWCGSRLSQANIVAERNIILVAAHSMYDDDCNLKQDAKDCFVEDYDENQYPIDMSTLISGPDARKALGKICKLPKEGLHATANEIDWAVVKLLDKVPNVIPYGIEVTSESEIHQTYMVPSAAAKNFADSKATTYQWVTWNDTEHTFDGLFFMKMVGDTGPRMSGAPALYGKNQIKAIYVREAFKNCTHGYDEEDCYAAFAPVTQAILDAVNQNSKR